MLPISYSFVIPAYNEANRISATLAAIASLSSSKLWQCEIIVADDGSTDNTADVAQAFSSPECPIFVHRFPHRGKGHAIRQGVISSHGEVIVLCDADLHDSVAEVLTLIEVLGKGVEIAIGSRWLSGADTAHTQSFIRQVSSRIYNLVTKHILDLPFKDTQCGLKTLTRKAADQVFPLLSLDGWGYDPEMIHVAVALGLRIEEVGLVILHDYRRSNFRPVRDGLNAFSELFKIRWKDMRGTYGARNLRCRLGSRARLSRSSM